MASEFAVSFKLTVVAKESQSPTIEVEDCEYLELPRSDGPDIRDVCESYEILQNINCYEKVEALQVGEYDCLLVGSWDYEITYDYEGNPDAELMIDIKYFEIQKHVEQLVSINITEVYCGVCRKLTSVGEAERVWIHKSHLENQ